MTLAMTAMCPAVAAGTVAGMGMAASCNTGWSMLAAATAMAAGISSIDAGIWREIYKVTDTSSGIYLHTLATCEFLYFITRYFV